MEDMLDCRLAVFKAEIVVREEAAGQLHGLR